MLNIGEFINKVMFHYHKDGNFLWKVRDDGLVYKGWSKVNKTTFYEIFKKYQKKVRLKDYERGESDGL
jgi:hypothetical protein